MTDEEIVEGAVRAGIDETYNRDPRTTDDSYAASITRAVVAELRDAGRLLPEGCVAVPEQEIVRLTRAIDELDQGIRALPPNVLDAIDVRLMRLLQAFAQAINGPDDAPYAEPKP